jgi:hypothetical protein
MLSSQPGHSGAGDVLGSRQFSGLPVALDKTQHFLDVGNYHVVTATRQHHSGKAEHFGVIQITAPFVLYKNGTPKLDQPNPS